MERLIKKYALVSTSYWSWPDSEWKNFHIILNDLSEDQVCQLQHGYSEFFRLWEECYAKEKENGKNRISEDLRTPLEKHLKSTYSGEYTLSTCKELWSNKDLIIEHFTVNTINNV
jgi:hypothetical protein